MLVKPTKSPKRTDVSRRSATGRPGSAARGEGTTPSFVALARAAPQDGQNRPRLPPAPQDGQDEGAASCAPHSTQKRAPSSLDAPQPVQPSIGASPTGPPYAVIVHSF